ncbi:MAG: enoyl-CoA hydratase/isomerase family protein, partial [Rothia dentocariosa]
MTNNTADNPAVLLERRCGIAYVTLNQPENRNTLSRHLATELREALNRLHEDDTLKAAVLTGAGQDFSLGGSYDDFAEGMSREKEESLAYSRDLARLLEDIILGIVAAPIPFIAAINGQAAGAGMSLALACDLRVAEPRTKLNIAYGMIGA